jgi:type VI protein secretion system component VasK
VTPPDSPTLVDEKNTPYVEALRQLRNSLQEMAESNNAEPASATARANVQKALETAQKLADGFRLADVAGLNTTVKRLLDEPIKHAEAVIPKPPSVEKDIAAALAKMGGRLRPLLTKYPFKRTTNAEDVSLADFNAAFAPDTGAVWVFAKALGPAVKKEQSQWIMADPAAKPQVSPAVLEFLNKAERITRAFYTDGATSAHLNYSLLPKQDPAGRRVLLEIDGQSHEWNGFIRKAFTWPSTGAEKGGRLRLLYPGSSVPVSSYGGVWGIFRIMDSGDFGESDGTIQWKYSGEGRKDLIDPPVQMDIVGLTPATVGVFKRSLFEGLSIPPKATQ